MLRWLEVEFGLAVVVPPPPPAEDKSRIIGLSSAMRIKIESKGKLAKSRCRISATSLRFKLEITQLTLVAKMKPKPLLARIRSCQQTSSSQHSQWHRQPVLLRSGRASH